MRRRLAEVIPSANTTNSARSMRPEANLTSTPSAS